MMQSSTTSSFDDWKNQKDAIAKSFSLLKKLSHTRGTSNIAEWHHVGRILFAIDNGYGGGLQLWKDWSRAVQSPFTNCCKKVWKVSFRPRTSSDLLSQAKLEYPLTRYSLTLSFLSSEGDDDPLLVPMQSIDTFFDNSDTVGPATISVGDSILNNTTNEWLKILAIDNAKNAISVQEKTKKNWILVNQILGHYVLLTSKNSIIQLPRSNRSWGLDQLRELAERDQRFAALSISSDIVESHERERRFELWRRHKDLLKEAKKILSKLSCTDWTLVGQACFAIDPVNLKSDFINFATKVDDVSVPAIKKYWNKLRPYTTADLEAIAAAREFEGDEEKQKLLINGLKSAGSLSFLDNDNNTLQVPGSQESGKVQEDHTFDATIFINDLIQLPCKNNTTANAPWYQVLQIDLCNLVIKTKEYSKQKSEATFSIQNLCGVWVKRYKNKSEFICFQLPTPKKSWGIKTLRELSYNCDDEALSTTSPPPEFIPSVPVNMKLLALDETEMTIGWDFDGRDNNNDDVIVLELEDGSGGALSSNYKQIYTEASSDTNACRVEGLSPNTSYRFRICVKNSSTDNYYSYASFTTLPSPPKSIKRKKKNIITDNNNQQNKYILEELQSDNSTWKVLYIGKNPVYRHNTIKGRLRAAIVNKDGYKSDYIFKSVKRIG